MVNHMPFACKVNARCLLENNLPPVRAEEWFGRDNIVGGNMGKAHEGHHPMRLQLGEQAIGKMGFASKAQPEVEAVSS